MERDHAPAGPVGQRRGEQVRAQMTLAGQQHFEVVGDEGRLARHRAQMMAGRIVDPHADYRAARQVEQGFGGGVGVEDDAFLIHHQQGRGQRRQQGLRRRRARVSTRTQPG
jgi:hypothetical protein